MRLSSSQGIAGDVGAPARSPSQGETTQLWSQLHNFGVFIEAARFDSLSAAARAANRATSALTRSIQMVETALGAELLERSARGVLLSPAGRLARLRGERIAADRDQC